MTEPPASWDQLDEENLSFSSATAKLSGLNVNAVEFVPSGGSGFSFVSQPSTVSQPIVSDTSPSIPTPAQNFTDDDKKQAETRINADNSNIQRQVNETITSESKDRPDETTG